jgi:hypothetical protein
MPLAWLRAATPFDQVPFGAGKTLTPSKGLGEQLAHLLVEHLYGGV